MNQAKLGSAQKVLGLFGCLPSVIGSFVSVLLLYR